MRATSDDSRSFSVASAYPASYFSSKQRSPWGRRRLLIIALAVYVVALGVLPPARLFVEAFLPGPNGELFGILLQQWRTPAAQTALIHTLEASALATLVSVLIGVVVAFLLALTYIRNKAALTFVALLPLLVPSQITALAWIELTSSSMFALIGLAPAPGATNLLYSKGGIVLVMGIEHSTLVFLAVRAGLRNLPRDLIEAARLGGAHPLRAARHSGPLHRADNAHLSAPAGLRSARSRRGGGARDGPRHLGGGRSPSAAGGARLRDPGRKRSARAVSAWARPRMGGDGAVDPAHRDRGDAAGRAARGIALTRARRAAAVRHRDPC